MSSKKIKGINKKEIFLQQLKIAGDDNTDNWWGYMNASQFEKHNPELELPEPLPYYLGGEISSGIAQDADVVESGGESVYEHRCICTQPIQNIAYIVHKTMEPQVALAVGCCCVLKCLDPDDRNKKCVSCKEPYRGPYDDCASCRDILGPRYVCTFGKHKGKKAIDIWNEDRSYVEYVWISEPEDDNDRMFKLGESFRLIDDQTDGITRIPGPEFICNFGKHKNKKAIDIWNEDRSYIKWIRTRDWNSSNFFDLMTSFDIIEASEKSDFETKSSIAQPSIHKLTKVYISESLQPYEKAGKLLLLDMQMSSKSHKPSSQETSSVLPKIKFKVVNKIKLPIPNDPKC